MKKYMKNKNFIPEKFLDKIKLRDGRNECIIIVMFLIINLYFLPTTVKDIKEVKVKAPAINNNIKEDKNNLNDIVMWLDNAFDENIDEAYITNDYGEIVVHNMEEISKLSLNQSLNIKDINLNSDKKYKLGVSLNE